MGPRGEATGFVAGAPLPGAVAVPDRERPVQRVAVGPYGSLRAAGIDRHHRWALQGITQQRIVTT